MGHVRRWHWVALWAIAAVMAPGGECRGAPVAARLEAIRAKGQPVSLADLAGPPVADDENGATLYTAIFQRLATPDEPGGQPGTQPTPWAPEPTAAVKADEEILSDYLGAGKRVADPGLYERARQAAARHQALPWLVAQAAARPACRFPIRWEDGFGAAFPHLARMRSLARILCAEAVLGARAGRMEEAARSLDAALALSESLRDDPVLIGQLVRYAIVGVASAALREVAEWGDLPADEARSLAGRLAAMDLRPGLVRALAGERAFGLWAFDRIREGGPGAVGETVDQDEHPWWWRFVGTYLWRPFLHEDEMTYLDLMEALIATAEAPTLSEGVLKGREAEAAALPRHAVVSRLVLPAVTNVFRARDAARAELAGSRALLALLNYRERFGAYPDSLADLEQRLEIRLPEDPLAGKPLAYRRQGEGFVLYSVGRDRRDDGGRPLEGQRGKIGAGLLIADRATGATTPAPEPGPDDPNAGDIVWQRGR